MGIDCVIPLPTDSLQMIFISESSSFVTLILVLYSAKSNPHSICRPLSVAVDSIRFTMISNVSSGLALQFLLIWLKHPMLYLVPFGCPWWKVGDFSWHYEIVSQDL